jgi:hypothetical protein
MRIACRLPVVTSLDYQSSRDVQIDDSIIRLLRPTLSMCAKQCLSSLVTLYFGSHRSLVCTVPLLTCFGKSRANEFLSLHLSSSPQRHLSTKTCESLSRQPSQFEPFRKALLASSSLASNRIFYNHHLLRINHHFLSYK